VRSLLGDLLPSQQAVIGIARNATLTEGSRKGIPVMATMDSAMQFSPCSSGLRRSPAELESSRCSYGYRMVTRKAPCFGDAPGGNRTRGLRLERPLSGRWHRLSLRRSAYCHCLGWSFGWSSISGPPKGPRCCPLAPEVWLCTWPEEGGPRLSASLRPGDPLPRPTHHRCLWRGQMQSVGQERAGSSRQKGECRNVRVLSRGSQDRQVGEE
jgi:hypothetical protein